MKKWRLWGHWARFTSTIGNFKSKWSASHLQWNCHFQNTLDFSIFPCLALLFPHYLRSSAIPVMRFTLSDAIEAWPRAITVFVYIRKPDLHNSSISLQTSTLALRSRLTGSRLARGAQDVPFPLQEIRLLRRLWYRG